MIIAYFIGKFAENQPGFSWQEIIEGGIFEFLQRIITTDLKPSIYYKIKQHKEKYVKLNEWIFQQLASALEPLGERFCQSFQTHFLTQDDNINKKILSAAHIFSSKWEFEIIKRLNPRSHDIQLIDKDFQQKIEQYYELEGMRAIMLHDDYKNFINLCGELRFQFRWSNLHRIPKTSVLGHSLFVAILTYLFSLELKSCKRRLYNNFYAGLFHDLPEVLTRDIVSPVKRSVAGLDELIKDFEKEQMEKIIYKIVPLSIKQDLICFTENEFETVIDEAGQEKIVSSEDINQKYNQDQFNPRDGRLLRAVDELSAFLEAYFATKNGCIHHHFTDTTKMLKEHYIDTQIGGINIGAIYAGFN
jgi:putative hydrolase of HD superfamily